MVARSLHKLSHVVAAAAKVPNAGSHGHLPALSRAAAAPASTSIHNDATAGCIHQGDPQSEQEQRPLQPSSDPARLIGKCAVPCGCKSSRSVFRSSDVGPAGVASKRSSSGFMSASSSAAAASFGHSRIPPAMWPCTMRPVPPGFRQHAQPREANGPGACFGGMRGINTLVGGREVEGRKRVAVGLSGGVDSAVAAWMLQQQGHEVIGVFMRNWDESEEKGDSACSADADWTDAQRVARHLGIPIHEANFVRQYWTQVFSDFVAQCGQGLTPNPDLACNRHIKFGALLEFCRGLGADCVATGHYARLTRCELTGRAQLLRGRDACKDQSYFLASVEGSAFAEVLFPLGDMLKAEVRRVAEQAGLPSAARRSSAGICFIGRRDFGDFIAEYAGAVPGDFVDVESGEVLGTCANLAAVTHGQGAGISGLPERVYVVGKNMRERVVYVARGRNHPALFCKEAVLQPPHWIAGEPPLELTTGTPLSCLYKARYRQVVRECTVEDLSQLASVEGSSIAEVARRSAHCHLANDDGSASDPSLLVQFEQPARAITPQQAFVLYSGDVCLGSAPVLHPGRSLFELGIPLDPSLSADTIDEAPAQAAA